jgi:glycosyltransferase involved in cell wall biosynthesis
MKADTEESLDEGYVEESWNHEGRGRQAHVASAAGKTDPASAAGPAARHVLFVTYGFPPSLEMGARSCAQIARYLPLYGWQPVVLTIRDELIEKEYRGTAEPSYSESSQLSIVKTGIWPHPLDFYRWAKSRFSSSQNSADEEPASGTAENGNVQSREGGATTKLRNLSLSLLKIPDMHTGWLMPGVIDGLRAIRKYKPKVILSSMPFFTAHLIGYLLSRFSGLPWVAHFRDPFVTTPTSKSNPRTVAERLNLALEGIIVRRADRIICVTEEHSATLRDAYPQESPDKFLSVPNGFDGQEWKEIDRERAVVSKTAGPNGNKFVILYAGQFYHKRSPEPLFRAMQALVESGDIDPKHLQVDLVGWCDTAEGRSVPAMAVEMGLQDCVNIVGPKERPETLRRMTRADLLLLLAEGWSIQIPGKTYEYLKAGRPILALTTEGSLANIVRRTHSGWSVDPSDHEGIKSAIHECYGHWLSGRTARSADPATVAGFDRRVTTGRLGAYLDELVALKREATGAAVGHEIH